MRIAYITGGSAGMYCGTCMHDNTLASALIERGHEVSLLPTYTPLRLDEESVATDRIFFSAVNVYLQQKLSFFRNHRWFDKLLDSRRLLGLIKTGASTDAALLGSLTQSMMEGEKGHQARELEKLLDFLDAHVHPQIVHLSFTLFAGFARRIKERLGVPVVCSLQGEDLFYDELKEPWRSATLDEMRSRLGDIDLFLAHSHYYADLMAEYGVPRERTMRTRLGIRPDGFGAAHERPGREGRPITLGYLARQCPEKGLHHVIDAFVATAPELPQLRLRLAGYLAAKDEAFVAEQRAKIDRADLGDRVDWHGAVDRAQKQRFLAGLDLFSVPAVYREPKGLYVVEALASGVPVLAPDHGAFPEWIEATGGGILVAPDDAGALADGIRRLAGDETERRRLAAAGRRTIHEEYNHEVMADEMLGIYERLLAGENPAAGSVAAGVDETAA